MIPKNENDNRQSSLTLQKIGAHHSIDLARIPVYLEASLHHWLPGLRPLGRNLLRPPPRRRAPHLARRMALDHDADALCYSCKEFE